MREIVAISGGIGYRSQLDRARRFLDRVQSDDPRRDIDYQDDVWAFFQNCWHIKDWLKHDYRVPKRIRDRAIAAAHASRVLRVCRDMANGTKHRKLTRRGKGRSAPRARAMHMWTSTKIVPGGPTTMDCLLKFPHRKVRFRSARVVAAECLEKWIEILRAHGLNTTQRS
jgi:hypothetical protein